MELLYYKSISNFTKPVHISNPDVITDTQINTCWVGSRRFVIASDAVKKHVEFMYHKQLVGNGYTITGLDGTLEFQISGAHSLELVGSPKTFYLPGIESIRYMSTTNQSKTCWCPIFQFTTKITLYGLDLTFVGLNTESDFDTRLFDIFQKYKPIPQIMQHYDYIQSRYRQSYTSFSNPLWLDILPCKSKIKYSDFDFNDTRTIDEYIKHKSNVCWNLFYIPAYLTVTFNDKHKWKCLKTQGKIELYNCTPECSNLHPKIIRYTIHNKYSKKPTASSFSNSTLRHTITSLSKNGGVLFDGNIDSDGNVKVRVQAGALSYHSVGYKLARHRYGDCIVKIGLFEDSLVAHEKESDDLDYQGQKDNKFRTNKCLVIGIIKLDTSYLTFDTLTEARSCVYTSDLVYKVGDLLVVTNFNNNLNKTCVSGIHFFYDPTCVLDFSGKEYNISNKSMKKLRNYTAFPDIKKKHMSNFKKLFKCIVSKESLKHNYDYTIKDASIKDTSIKESNIIEQIDEYPIDMSMIETGMCGNIKLKMIRMLLIENTKDDTECVLCTLKYDTTIVKTFLPCGHHYCNECIKSPNRWIYKESKCPMCKKSFTR